MKKVREQVKKKPMVTLIIMTPGCEKYLQCSVDSKGFCFYNNNGLKTSSRCCLGFPSPHCTKANVSDDSGLIDADAQHRLFTSKPVNIPKITPARPVIILTI